MILVLRTGLSSSLSRSVTANAVAVATSSTATMIVGASLFTVPILEFHPWPSFCSRIDFEDWHQLVHRGLGRADWDMAGPALERQTAAIFALLDELEREGHVLRPGDDRRALPGPRARDRRGATSSPVTATPTGASPPRRQRTFEPRRRARRLAARELAASARSATARLPSRSPARPRGPTTCWPSSASATTRASTTRRASAAHRTAYRARRTGSSSTTIREIWEYPVTVWSVKGHPFPMAAEPIGVPSRPPLPAGRGAAGGRRRELTTLCCTSTRTSSTRSRCGRRCRRAHLPGSVLLAAWKSVQRNPGRRRSWIEFVQLPANYRSSATRRPMEKSSNATELVRDHFREQASSFDALYDEEHPLQRAVRPGC